MSIHPSSVVSPGAQIGNDVEIGPFSMIGPNVVLGDGCKIHHHVSIQGHTTLGDGCEVFPQAVLGMPPQDLKFEGESTTLEFGSRNVIREMVTAHPGTANGGGVTRIGNGNFFLVGVHIAHDCHIENNCVIANYVQFAGHVHVEENVNIGGHCAVHHFVTIGKNAFIGGMTRVSADVPPFMVVVAARGSRSEVRMVNGVGLQRSGYSHEDIGALKEVFMKLFSRRARLSGTGISERVQAIVDSEHPNPHAKYLCDFLMRSFAHGRHGRYLESLRADPVHRGSWKHKKTYDLDVNIVGRGSVERVRRVDAVTNKETMQLTANAEDGWSFDGWNGNLSGASNPVTVMLDSDKTVTATFVTANA